MKHSHTQSAWAVNRSKHFSPSLSAAFVDSLARPYDTIVVPDRYHQNSMHAMIPAMMNMTMMMMIIIKTTIIGDYLKTSWFFHFFITVSFNLIFGDNATYSCEQCKLFVFCERVKNVDLNLKKFWKQTSVST